MIDLCEAMNRFGKGIGSTPRYRIVEALFSGPKTVGELSEKIKQSQPLVSQHLRILKETRLVRDERRGQEVLYTFNAKYTIQLLKNLSEEFKLKQKRKT